MSFKDFVTDHRRLFILQLLNEVGGEASEGIVYDVCRRHFVPNRGLTRDALHDDLEWLRERHLVAFDWLDDTVLLVKLTERGGYVVSGDIEVDGVTRPRRNG